MQAGVSQRYLLPRSHEINATCLKVTSLLSKFDFCKGLQGICQTDWNFLQDRMKICHFCQTVRQFSHRLLIWQVFSCCNSSDFCRKRTFIERCQCFILQLSATSRCLWRTRQMTKDTPSGCWTCVNVWRRMGLVAAWIFITGNFRPKTGPAGARKGLRRFVFRALFEVGISFSQVSVEIEHFMDHDTVLNDYCVC